MKAAYQKPSIELEFFKLDTNIASNCTVVVSMGPEAPGAIKVCDDYYDKTGEDRPNNSIALFSLPHNVQFWSQETCDCYTSAYGNGCFTS